MLGAVRLNRPRAVSALTARDYRTMARVLAEVAAQPTVDVKTMQNVIWHTVCTLIDEDPLTFNPTWFCDLIISHLTELQTRQAMAPAAPEGVSPHTRVITLDHDAGVGQVTQPNPPRRSDVMRSLQRLKVNISNKVRIEVDYQASHIST